jgi:hypothetical protein
MNSYVMRKMYRHLADLLFVNAVFVSLVRSGKSSHVMYDIKLVNQPIRDVLISAATIGTSFSIISVVLVFMVQYNQDIRIVIAAIFISLGMGRQIVATALDTVTTSMNGFLSSWASILHLLAKDRPTPEWRLIENQIERIFYDTELDFDLPAKLDGVKQDSPQVQEYLNEHARELEYQRSITDEDHSLLAFAQHATKNMRDKLLIYNQLLEAQARGGGMSAVVLISVWTLIWLLS